MKAAKRPGQDYSEVRAALLQFIHRNPSLQEVTQRFSDARLAALINDLAENLQMGIPVLPPAGLSDEISRSPKRHHEWKKLRLGLDFGKVLSSNDSAFLAMGLLWLTLLEEAIRERIRNSAQPQARKREAAIRERIRNSAQPQARKREAVQTNSARRGPHRPSTH